MKSIKPGRGPSFMNGIMSIASCIFGVFWTLFAISMGAPIFFPLFGCVFIAIGVIQAVYSFKNAMGENRFSSFDITDSGEETDPFNSRFGPKSESSPRHDEQTAAGGYCPYCGFKMGLDHLYCKNCGRRTS